MGQAGAMTDAMAADGGTAGGDARDRPATAGAAVRIVADPRGDAAFLAAWRDLAGRAATPVLTAEPAWVSAAYDRLPAQARRARLCAVHDGGGPDGALLALWPCEIARWRWGLPIRAMTGWSYEHAFLGAPLLDADRAEEALCALVSGHARETGPVPILMRHLPAGDATLPALDAACAKTGAMCHVLKRYNRAAFRPTGHAGLDDYLRATFPRKRRKEFNRLKARLGEQGALALERFGGVDGHEDWLDRFAALEAKGWKGRKGTALGADAETRAFFGTLVDRLAGHGSVRGWALTLDGEPVAMLFAMTSGRRAWLGKIAYDEAYSRFSPGVLVTLEATADLCAEPGIELVDSCAIPGHPMIDRLWHDRLEMADILVTPAWMGIRGGRALAALERARATGMDRARRIVKSLAGDHPS